MSRPLRSWYVRITWPGSVSFIHNKFHVHSLKQKAHFLQLKCYSDGGKPFWELLAVANRRGMGDDDTNMSLGNAAGQAMRQSPKELLARLSGLCCISSRPGMKTP